MNIAAAIQQLFPGAQPGEDFVVTSVKGVQAIAKWSLKDSQGNPVAQPTADQLTAADTAAQLSQARAAKAAALNAAYAAALGAGVTVSGVTLPASDNDQAQFAHLLVLLREAQEALPDSAQAGFEASQQTIVDAAGIVHQPSVTDVRALIVAYGQAIYAAKAALFAKLAAVNAASTVEAVGAIS